MEQMQILHLAKRLLVCRADKNLANVANHSLGTSIHPLPPKPSLTSRISPRGVKRGVSPLTQELKTVRPAKRSFQWPTVESTHRVRIKGDGDVSIQGIAFSSDGSQFAVNCE